MNAFSRVAFVDALNKSIARFQPGKLPPSPRTRSTMVGIPLNTNEDSAHDPLQQRSDRAEHDYAMSEG